MFPAWSSTARRLAAAAGCGAALPAAAAALTLDGSGRPPLGDRVVVAEVLDAESSWVPGPVASIETVVRLGVDEVLFGPPVDGVLELRLPGGTASGVTLVVEDVPRLVPGQVGRFRLDSRPDGTHDLISASGLDTPGEDPLPYVLSGDSWSWEDVPIETPFRLVTNFPTSFGSEDDVIAAFQAVLDTWTYEGGAAVRIDYGGEVGSANATGDGNLYAMYAQGQSGSGGTLAVSQWWTDGGHRMTDCDILFYPSNGYGTIDWSATGSGPNGSETDFESVALHEMGHCLGLGHSASSSAVMAASIMQGTTKRDLTNDDRNGVQAIYGPGCEDLDHDGYSPDADCETGQVDCDDSDAAVHPGADEVCDGDDNDCQGDVDEGFPADEADCDDGEDNDCDGDVDAADADCASSGDDDAADDDASGGDDDAAAGDDEEDEDDDDRGPREVLCGCRSGPPGAGSAAALLALAAAAGSRRWSGRRATVATSRRPS